MIRRLQALNYRCLRHVDVRMDRFHILVGANASGKSTLFDAIAFLGDMVRSGVPAAIDKRTNDFRDLVWGGAQEKQGFQLALEFDIPDMVRAELPAQKDFRTFRYEVSVKEGEIGPGIEMERGLLLPTASHPPKPVQRSLFPMPLEPVSTIVSKGGKAGTRTIFSKSPKGTDSFHFEVSSRAGKGWVTSISFGPHRSTFGNLPESPKVFPVATYMKRFLESRIKRLFLDSERMRAASPPNLRHVGFSDGGGSLPWQVKNLKTNDPASFDKWLAHVRTTLKDIRNINVSERPEDRHAYLEIKYRTGVEIPSWTASDGTLRFLAMTLIPYLSDKEQLFMLEEPENGIHPLALEAVYDSLTSAYDSQILVATHSPTFLRQAKPKNTLCFAKDDGGMTDIIHGIDHPLLENWQKSVDMNLLFATGIIGSR